MHESRHPATYCKSTPYPSEDSFGAWLLLSIDHIYEVKTTTIFERITLDCLLAMTSHPPGKCCLTGVKHEGTAVGEFKTIGDCKLQTSNACNEKRNSLANVQAIDECYVSQSANGDNTNAILFLTDAVGHRSINTHLQVLPQNHPLSGCDNI